MSSGLLPLTKMTRIGKNLKFSANISSLFIDIPDHIESYQEILKRKDFQFTAIEAQDPYKNSLEEWKKMFADLSPATSRPEFVLINSPNLFNKYSDRLPTPEEFDLILNITGDYVKALNVRKVHLLLTDIKDSSQMTEIKQLLINGARFFNKLNVTCLIEPLAPRPNYYLRSYDLALQLVKEINEPNFKLMFDTFHCQRLHGNITHYMETLKDYIGHVQISQVPLRDCPVSDGELNHDYILKKMPTIYDDYIGLEYFNYADDDFEWIKKYTNLTEE